ncbi:B3 domain-containing protein REM14-like [Silene latifolia]|uniref:B3 domain-containing protein REM14-like n=1 Tax=Silene latifolia TaxID=37657 RepID=UPI003D77C135
MLKDKRNGIWYVKVSYKEGKVHFKDGWRKFCEEHGLQVGDFLVFKYQGNLIFDVIVFDPSACERTFLQTSIVSSDIVPYACINGNGDVKIEHISDGGLVANVAFKPRGFPYYHTSVKLYWRKWGGMGFRSSVCDTSLFIYSHGSDTAYLLYVDDIVLTASSTSLAIPTEFARENGIDKRRCKIKVTEERGRSWSMQVSCS